MRVGLFMTPQWRPDADLETGFRELLGQARAARENGFSSLLVGQHVLTGPEMQMFQTVPLMARLLPEIEGMQIGPGVLLLSMMSPVMTAEEGATLDWMSDGNYVLAAGLGYRAEEFEAMGARKSERVSRLEEALEVVKRLWSEERVTHHGQHFHIGGVGASVRPKRRPRPPIWLGGDVEPAIRRAARIADAWLGAPTSSLAQLQGQLRIFADERRQVGLGAAACPVIREAFVGRDTAHARAVSRGPLKFKYEAYAAWGQNDTRGHDIAGEFDGFCADRFLIGDVSRVREEILRFGEQLGTDHLILRIQWPGLPQAEAIANIERLGQAVAGIRA
jgi:alkanesulfonate monooxygenase SsuD/methylene tetrahydromethanopterin reductase-like flavin-dependent oxidoreductase (luciferase family)